MLRNTWWALLPAVLVAGLLGAPAAQARDVKDEADLVKKPENLAKINQVIRDIKKNYGKEVLIETTSSVPSGDATRVKDMLKEKDKDGLNTYFFELAKKRASQSKVDGVYVLIVKSPSRWNILTNKKTEPYFDRNQNKKMRDIMAAQFKEGDYDTGLLQGVEYLRDEFAKNPPNKSAVVPPVAKQPKAGTGGVFKDDKGEWNWTGIICVGLVVLVVIWLIFGLIRGMSGAGGGGGGAPGYAGGGGGGGGFMTGLLGGLFGAMAGNWLYHNMFGGGGSQAYGGDSGASPGSTGADDDYTGTGGGADDAGGGGGDAGGGGDVGGGDWGGGGGGDWGGGGGFGGGDFGGGGGGDF